MISGKVFNDESQFTPDDPMFLTQDKFKVVEASHERNRVSSSGRSGPGCASESDNDASLNVDFAASNSSSPGTGDSNFMVPASQELGV